MPFGTIIVADYAICVYLKLVMIIIVCKKKVFVDFTFTEILTFLIKLITSNYPNLCYYIVSVMTFMTEYPTDRNITFVA